MKKVTLGFILIVLGVVMMAYTGFNYVTTERIVDIGPLHVNQEVNHAMKWPPVLGGLLLLGGIAIIVFGKKQDA